MALVTAAVRNEKRNFNFLRHFRLWRNNGVLCKIYFTAPFSNAQPAFSQFTLFTNYDQRKMHVRPEYKREEAKAIQIRQDKAKIIQIRQSPALKSVPNPGSLQIMEPSVAYIYLLVSKHKPRIRVCSTCKYFLGQTLPTIDACIFLMLGLLVKYCLCLL